MLHSHTHFLGLNSGLAGLELDFKDMISKVHDLVNLIIVQQYYYDHL